MSSEREEAVYLAKLAEQAERYDEMVNEMKKVGLSQRVGPLVTRTGFEVRAVGRPCCRSPRW